MFIYITQFYILSKYMSISCIGTNEESVYNGVPKWIHDVYNQMKRISAMVCKSGLMTYTVFKWRKYPQWCAESDSCSYI